MKNKEARSAGAKRYVRRIPVERLGAKGQTQKEQTLELTVRGLHNGRVRLEAKDGTAYSCVKARSRGALWGDVVEAVPLGG